MLVEAKEFPKISFDSIPISCRSNLLFHHDAQSMEPQFILLKKEDEMLGMDPFA